jgi:hypothetical protein
MTASRPADITAHNKPLHEAMIARGCKWVSTSSKEYFTFDGEYEPYPAGYIRGPQFHENGNPRPYSYSVQGRNGWLQRSFTHQEVLTEGPRWALETAQSVLIPVNNCGGVGECCGCEVCTPDEPYEREECEACEGSGQNDDGSECFGCKGFGDKIVDANTPSGVVGEHIEWTDEIGHNRRDVIAQLDEPKSGIEVAQEALDIEPTDKTTLAYLMFQELDLEASDRYQFIKCPWDSPVGYECMKVIRKAREFADMLHDLDSHQDIWSAAFEQCEVFFCG